MPLVFAACVMINPDYDEVEPEDDGAGTIGPAGTAGPDGATEEGSGGGGSMDGDTGAASGDESGSIGDTGDTGSGSGDPMTWSFDTIEPVDELNSDANDDDPTLRTDLLEIYFASRRGGNEEIYVATRSSVDDVWDVPEAAPFGNGAGDETSPELSADGLTLTFARDSPGQPSGHDIWITTRISVDDAWMPALPFGSLNENGFETSAVFADDPLDLMLCASRRDTIGATDIYRANVDGLEGAALFDRLASLSSGAGDCDIFVDPAAEIVVFASDRSGTWDLWRASANGNSWGGVQAITDLNTDGGDNDPWLSPSTGILYFSRDDGSGYDIYRAVSSPE